MQKINIDQMQAVLKYGLLGLNETPFFVGQFGAGKTAGVEQFVLALGGYLCKVLLGQYDTVDLKGTPWVLTLPPAHEDDEDEPHKITVWHPAATLPFKGNPNFPTDRPIFLFLDEITSATVPVLGICYQLINEHRVGEHELMDNVYIICAGNRDLDKGIVSRIPMPLYNRVTQFEVVIDLNVWCRHIQHKYGEKAAIFVAFLQWRKSPSGGLLCTYDPAKPDKVVATPRTIEKALKYYNADMPSDIKMACMSGAVGEGWTAEFWGFVKIWQQIDGLMKNIIKDPEKAAIPDETSTQWAVALSISGNLTVKTCKNYYRYLRRMEPEYVIAAWQMAISRDKDLFATDEFVDIARRYKAVFS